MRRAWAAAALAGVASVTNVALAAPTKDECVDSNTRGQELRRHEQLRAAREAFRTCADPACPSVVRADCEARLEDVARAVPTVVLDATGADGKITNVKVTVDGAPFAAVADGAPIEIDPGSHHFVFRAAGYPDVALDVGVEEGARDQRVSASFEDATRAAAPRSTTLRTAGIAVSAAGIAGIAVASAFGAASFAAWGSVKSECILATSCDYAQAGPDRDRAIAFATISDVGFVVGGVLAAAGVVLFVLGTQVTATVAPRVIGLSVTEAF